MGCLISCFRVEIYERMKIKGEWLYKVNLSCFSFFFVIVALPSLYVRIKVKSMSAEVVIRVGVDVNDVTEKLL